MNHLEVNGLVKRFGGLLATDHVDLALARGEIHAVIGPNGAGKTTLINQLSGEILSDEGRIVFDGQDLTGLPPHRRAMAGLGRSFQITSVFNDFTVLQNAALAVQAHAGHSFRFWRPAAAERELTEPALAALAQVAWRNAHTRRCRCWRMASAVSWRSRWCWPPVPNACCWTSRWPA